MTGQTSPAKCLRPGCGRTLTAPASIDNGRWDWRCDRPDCQGGH